MRKRLAVALATGVLAVAMLPGVASAGPPGNPGADIDPDDCDVEIGSLEKEWNATEAQLHVTVNKNWIIATCHRQLDETEFIDVGAPTRAQVYRDFACSVGDGEDIDELEATQGHAVVTPSGRLNIVCKAPFED